MQTIKDVFNALRQRLHDLYELQELEAVTLLILNEVTGKSNAQLKAFPETVITDAQADHTRQILEQLITGTPVQYALGKTEFYGLPFIVTPAVLIPRPETEELVDWILQDIKKSTQDLSRKMLDIGTGSGCIPISLKLNMSNSEMFAIDISPFALQVARQNASLNKADVTFIEADILNPNSYIQQPLSGFSIIVSNPPYVTQMDKQQMHGRVTDFEPHTALFVPEHEPLLFYKAIADFALENLVKDGLLYFEINESYGPATVEMLRAKGFKNIELRKDMQGKDRMIKATL